jgi:hypothetical protein
MEFLVLMKLTDDGVGKDEKENKEIVENKILPSLEMLLDMEKEGVLSGGFFEGQRSAAFVMSVEDEETLDNTLTTLPCADIFEIEMVQLEPLKEAMERDKKFLKPAPKKATRKAK